VAPEGLMSRIRHNTVKSIRVLHDKELHQLVRHSSTIKGETHHAGGK
jgi:hypothetical protein